MLLSDLRGFPDALAAGPSRPSPIYYRLVIIESYHDASDVIECFLCDTCVEHGIYRGTAPGMHGLWRFQVFGLETSLPYLVHDLLVAHFLKNSVASDNYEVIVIFNLEGANLRLSDDHCWVSTIALILSLNVTYGA